MKVFRFDEIDSTNLEAWRRIEAGEGMPFIVVARTQTSGYGRQGHKWYSPEGGLWFSLAFEGDYRPELMSLAAAYAVAHTTKEVIDFCPRIRIPNDIVFGRKKVAGILIESKPPANVLGVGINLNVKEFPEELKSDAVSLHKVARSELDPDRFMELITSKFLKTLQSGNVSVSNWLCCLGQTVVFRCGDREVTGKFMGLLDFNVAVELDDGQLVECPVSLISDFRRAE